MARKTAITNYEKLQAANAKRAAQSWRDARDIADRMGRGEVVTEADRAKIRQFVTSKAKYINKRLKEYEAIPDEYQRPRIWHTMRNMHPTGKARMSESYKRASDDMLAMVFNKIDYLYDIKGRRDTSMGGIPTAKELLQRERKREDTYVNRWRLEKWAITSRATDDELRALARERVRMRDYAMYIAGDDKALYLDDLYDNYTTPYQLNANAMMRMERIVREQYNMRKGVGVYGDPMIKQQLKQLIGNYEEFAPTGTRAPYNAQSWQRYASTLVSMIDNGATDGQVKSVIMSW